MSITRRLPRTVSAVVVALTSAVVLAACGGGDDNTAAQPGADASFNLADVGFAQQMIPHHSQAVKMATLATTRAKDPKVMKLAAEILAAQGPEIETMQTLLENWSQPLVPDMTGMAGMEGMTPEEMAAMTPSGGTMPGMAEKSELEKLSAAKGAAFDQLFLTLMLEHHRGALEMAKMQRSEGKAPEAVELAEDIENGQSAEITRMKRLQKS